MNYHHPIIRRLRSWARKSGILKNIKNIVTDSAQSYEEKFHKALQSAVSKGDTVWDIGANIGLYTKYFLEWSGETGKVVAFEPLPKAMSFLKEAIKNHPLKRNVLLQQTALSDKEGEAFFSNDVATDGVTTTAHLVDRDSAGKNEIVVRVSTADIELQQIKEQPNVVKIDVEGFEENVLKGGSNTFNNPQCRHLLIEMHFTRMDERKLGDSPSRIVSILKSWGYKIKWVDPSHIHASRQ